MKLRKSKLILFYIGTALYNGTESNAASLTSLPPELKVQIMDASDRRGQQSLGEIDPQFKAIASDPVFKKQQRDKFNAQTEKARSQHMNLPKPSADAVSKKAAVTGEVNEWAETAQAVHRDKTRIMGTDLRKRTVISPMKSAKENQMVATEFNQHTGKVLPRKLRNAKKQMTQNIKERSYSK